jgi:hypothetical protein
MKRKICLAISLRFAKVIALALSFVVMFTSVASAGEIIVSATQDISPSVNVENIVKSPVNQPNSPSLTSKCGECQTANKEDGLLQSVKDGSKICLPRRKLKCGECTTNGAYGYKLRITPTTWVCQICG